MVVLSHILLVIFGITSWLDNRFVGDVSCDNTLGGKSIAAWTKDFQDDNPSVRYRAILELSKARQHAIPALLGMLTTEHEAVRMGVLQTLARIGPDAKTTVPALVRLVGREQLPSIRGYAILTAASISAGVRGPYDFDSLFGDLIGPVEPAVVRLLVDSLQDENSFVRACAVNALGRAAPFDKATLRALIECLADHSTVVRSRAAISLGRIGPEAKESLSALNEQLKDKDLEMRISVAFALWRIDRQGRRSAEVLVHALREGPTEEERALQDALMALFPENREIRSSQVVEDLLKVHPSRLKAIEILREIGPDAKDAVPQLILLLKDDSQTVRVQAACSLWEIERDHKRVVSILSDELAKTAGLSTQTLCTAIRTLAKIGPAGAAAKMNLSLLLNHANPEVRMLTTSALMSIEANE